MLLVDYRAGSSELVLPLQSLGLDVDEVTLDSADIAFEGRGEGGVPVQVGIEYKKLSEYVGALRSDRLSGHQLLKMQAYDFRYLIIEGELIYGADGYLMEWKGKGRHRELVRMHGSLGIAEHLKRLFVMHLRGGLNWMESPNQRHTLKLIEMLYRTWTDKDLDEHDSHIAIYQPPLLHPASQMMITMNSFPNNGYRVAAALQKRFKSIRKAIAAGPEDWANVEIKDKKGKTKKFGMKRALDIQAMLDEEA